MNANEGIGPAVEVEITARMVVELHPYNSYSDYIGLPGFPDIPDEEVRKLDVEELAKRMVQVDDKHGEESLGAAYNEDWEITDLTAKVVE